MTFYSIEPYMKTYFVILTLVVGNICLGQQVTQIIPPSPEASSIGKFIDQPVSLYNGIPGVSIPIYTLKMRDMRLPITLNYHSSGLKVEEIPTWAGAGWNLAVSGVVSRTLRGLNDEMPNLGYFSDRSKAFLSLGLSCTQEEYYDFLFASQGGIDLQPDLFFYHLPGSKSGKFVFDQDKNIHLVPVQPIVISDPFDIFPPSKWVINDDDGTQYLFGTGSTGNTAIEITDNTSSCVSADPNGYGEITPQVQAESTWHLLEMISPNRQDTIKFTYETDHISYDQLASETRYDNISGAYRISPKESSCVNRTSIDSKRLRKVTTSWGDSVSFIPSVEDRRDLNGAKKLDAIGIYVKGKLLKKVKFYHHYLLNGGDQYTNYLLLDSIKEFSCTNDSLPPYIFQYHSGSPKGRLSMAKDYWGYNNGNTNDTSIPSIFHGGKLYAGANRNANYNSAVSGVLRKITYPTEGFHFFEYELHNLGSYNTSNPISPGPDLETVIDYKYTIPVKDLEDISKTIFFHEESFVLDTIAEVLLRWDTPCGRDVGEDCHVDLFKDDIFFKNLNHKSRETIEFETLEAGNYDIRTEVEKDLFFEGRDYVDLNFRVLIRKKIDPTPGGVGEETRILEGGGLRIKRIVINDNLDEESTVYKRYEYLDADGETTAKLFGQPSYHYNIDASNGIPGNGDASCVGSGEGTNQLQEGSFLVRTSHSNVPLSTSQGGHVGYSLVTVLYGRAPLSEIYEPYPEDHPGVFDTLEIKFPANGKSVYQFTNYSDVKRMTYPFLSNISYAYKNGLPIKETHYKWESDHHKKVAEKTNYYGYQEYAQVPSFKIAATILNQCNACVFKEFTSLSSHETSEYFWLDSTIERTFQAGLPSITKRTKYVYDNYQQVSQIWENTGTGQERITEYKYITHPHYTQGNFRILLDRNAVSTRVEESTIFMDVGDLESFRTSHSNITTFKSVGQMLLPESVYRLETVVPIFNIWAPFDGSVIGDNRYKEVMTFDKYDEWGNISLFHDQSRVPKVHLWSEDGRYPIAQIVNQEDASNAFYTGFENNGTPTSTAVPALTGKKYLNSGTYNFCMDASFCPADPTMLKMSYWYWLDGWHFSGELDFSPTINRGQGLDEIRVYARGACMKTYVYDPGVGIITETDENNLSKHYEYDPFNRLKGIRDHHNNILTVFEYTYGSQTNE